MKYTWDSEKDRINRQKHGLSLADGVKVLQLPDQFLLSELDLEHSIEEDRWTTVGLVEKGVLFVVHTEEHGDEIRIISVRRANSQERHSYFSFLEG